MNIMRRVSFVPLYLSTSTNNTLTDGGFTIRV